MIQAVFYGVVSAAAILFYIFVFYSFFEHEDKKACMDRGGIPAVGQFSPVCIRKDAVIEVK